MFQKINLPAGTWNDEVLKTFHFLQFDAGLQ